MFFICFTVFKSVDTLPDLCVRVCLSSWLQLLRIPVDSQHSGPVHLLHVGLPV